jgi:hypothetical protein
MHFAAGIAATPFDITHMKRIVSMLAVLLGLFLAGAANAAPAVSVDGEWDVVYNTPGGPRNFKLVLNVDGEKLSGTAKRPAGDVPVEGTIKGESISFAFTIIYGGNPLTLSFSGRVSGDKMSGTVIIGSTQEDWSASRPK